MIKVKRENRTRKGCCKIVIGYQNIPKIYFATALSVYIVQGKITKRFLYFILTLNKEDVQIYVI